MSIILPNLNHSFISPVLVLVPVPVPVPVLDSGFRIPDSGSGSGFPGFPCAQFKCIPVGIQLHNNCCLHIAFYYMIVQGKV